MMSLVAREMLVWFQQEIFVETLSNNGVKCCSLWIECQLGLRDKCQVKYEKTFAGVIYILVNHVLGCFD